MDLFNNIIFGFGVALSPQNLLFCFIGALIGTLIGVLPGIGPLATLAMLLPATFYLPPIPALIMLAGIYYGAQYGGSTTAILVNVPGESSSVVTCLDGHQMARKGRAGAALAIAALGSLFAGTVATFIIAIASPPLSRTGAAIPRAGIFLADGARPRRLHGAGAWLAAQRARDGVPRAAARASSAPTSIPAASASRSTSPVLADGIGFVPVAMGLFGIAEILINLEKPDNRYIGAVIGTPDADARGIPPGGARGAARHDARVASSASCRAAARCWRRSRPMRSRRRSRAIRPASVRAPSRASPRRRAPTTPVRRRRSFRCSRSASRPIPVMALMIGAMMIQGIAPGPQVMTQQPDLFWGIIAVDVDRQPDAGDHQPAAGRHLGDVPQGALPHRCFRRSCCCARSASTASTTRRSRSA